MKKVFLIIGIISSLCACRQENRYLGEGEGALSLQVTMGEAVEVVSRTSLGNEEIEALKNDCKVRIYEGDKLIRKYSSWSSVPEKIDLSAGTDYRVSVDEYKKDIQKELEKIITQIDGAGKCSVMVTFDNATENVFAYNSTREKDDKGEKQRNEYVIVKNNGDETPIVVKEIQPSIRGVIVVCEGGDNVKVKQDITESISCVFSIPSSRISVNKMSVNKER